MLNWLKTAVFLLGMLLPLAAQAGAWPQAKGDTQVIISYEPGKAHEGFDGAGHKTIDLAGWKTNEAALYVDRGVTDRLSLTAKVNYRDYTTELKRFSGLSSVEIGGRYTFKHSSDFVFAVGASIEGLGKGRRTDFDVSAKGGDGL